MKVVRKRFFFLSSANKQAGESTNKFSIMFPPNLMKLQPNELIRITMVYFSMINSIQNINNNNNSFTITMKYGASFTTTAKVTLPNGNYSIADLATNLGTAVTNAFTTANGGQSLGTFTCSIPSSATNQCLWSWDGTSLPNGGNNVTSVKLTFSGFADSCAQILGFTGDTTIFSGSTSTTFTYTTPNAMYSGQEPVIQIHADIPPQNVSFNAANNMLNYSDILAQVPIIVPPGSLIVFQEFAGDNNCFEMPSKGLKLGTINFYVTNRRGVPLLLNNDFDFTLKIEVLQDDEKEHLDVAKSHYDLAKLQTLNFDKYFNR